MKRLLAIIVSILLLVSVSFTLGCNEKVETYSVKFELQCEVDGTPVYVTVNGKDTVATKRYAKGKKVVDIVKDFEVATTDPNYEFDNKWVYVVNSSEAVVKDDTVVSSAIAKNGTITLRPICKAVEIQTYVVEVQLDYEYANYSKKGVTIHPSYISLNGQTGSFVQSNVAKNTNLLDLLNSFGTPVELNSNGKPFTDNDKDYSFYAWYYKLNNTLYKIDGTEIISSEIANDGVISVVAVCVTDYVGPF